MKVGIIGYGSMGKMLLWKFSQEGKIDKENLFNTRQAFEGLYKAVFSPALTHFGVSEKDKKYVFVFYTQGTIAIIGEWLDGDCQDDVDMIIGLIMKHTLAYENNQQD